jgi:hypothetical protein
VAIVDDTTTNATRYLTFTSATTGNITTENVSSTKLQFNPSTGVLSSTSISYTGTLTGGTGVINIGSGQLYKDASGNVGIGTSSPAFGSGSGLEIERSDSNATLRLQRVGSSSSTAEFRADASAVSLESRETVPLIFGTNATERARIDSSGYLLVNTTTGGSNRHHFYGGGSGNNGVFTLRNIAADAGKFHFIGPSNASSPAFIIYNQDSVGVAMSDGGTSWFAASDERMKTELTPFEDAVEKVCSLRAGTGRYLTDDESKSRSFLIAQDVQKVLPEAVTVQADEMGTLGLAYTEVIPLLVAAIKEQQATINDLKARLDAANL